MITNTTVQEKNLKKERSCSSRQKIISFVVVGFLKKMLLLNPYFSQGWDTVQAFASSISGSLATAAVLEVCSLYSATLHVY
jgi:hypothetical protein